MTADIKRKIALWVAVLAIGITAALAVSQAFSGASNAPARPLDNISLQTHKRKCDDFKGKKKKNCKDDCGRGPGGYGRQNDHPDHPRQCRNY